MVESVAFHTDAYFTRRAFPRFFAVVGDDDEVFLEQIVIIPVLCDSTVLVD